MYSFGLPPSAILFLNYKSVKSGEEVAGERREIQSVMKNYVVWRCHSLFQHLPAVLDEDVASVAVGTADVRIVMRYVL